MLSKKEDDEKITLCLCFSGLLQTMLALLLIGLCATVYVHYIVNINLYVLCMSNRRALPLYGFYRIMSVILS